MPTSTVVSTPPVEDSTDHSPLTADQEIRLTHLEMIVKVGLDSFLEVAEALHEIREKRLYKSEYANFDEYCRNRWCMSKHNAHRIIQSAEVVQSLKALPEPPAVFPKTVGVARELVKTPAKRREKVWNEAIRNSEGNTPTGRDVAVARDRLSISGVKGGEVIIAVEPIPREPGCDDDMESNEESNEEFLAGLPARAEFQGHILKRFDAEALSYRETTDLRLRYAAEFRKAVKVTLKSVRGKLGPWTVRQVNIAKSVHPKQWTACADCKGTGQVPLVGNCGTCYGEGFHVSIRRD